MYVHGHGAVNSWWFALFAFSAVLITVLLTNRGDGDD